MTSITTLRYKKVTEVQELEETKAKNREKLSQLSKPEGQENLEFKVDGSVWKNGELIAERITEEQEQWVKRKIHDSARSWERWYQ